VPAALRPALHALWRLDVTLGEVLATGRDPMVSRIRLAWWREALEKLDLAPPPAEPVLQSLAAHVVRRGVSGAELAAMEEGWAELLSEEALGETALGAYAAARGGQLFRLSARLLGGEEEMVRQAGGRWALVDLARRSSNPVEAAAACDLARRGDDDSKLNRKLRALGMLDLLAKRDLNRRDGSWECQGSPARMARILAYRLTAR
jgi:phytoene synthase